MTLDTNAIHLPQCSENLTDWVDDDSTLLTSSYFRLLRFTTVASTEPRQHYRVAIFPPPAAYADDFETAAERWIVETAAGDTQWGLKMTNIAILMIAASGENAWGTNLAGITRPAR